MMRELAHRGVDGHRLWVKGCVALGHQHFRTTPEEEGETQPTVVAGGRVQVLLDGRLENREELLAGLQIADPHPSDATLIGEAYLKWEALFVERLEGPFALVVYDAAEHRVLCARDALGERRLFYAMNERVFVAASEPRAVLAFPGVPPDQDEASVAEFCAVLGPPPGATYYRFVRQLGPAQLLVVDRGRARTRKYWQPGQSGTVRYRDDRQYAEHFRELLDRSVRCCLRGAPVPAVLMSSGLDSTSVAALAAQAVPVRAVSWVFDDLRECDERWGIDAVVRKAGLHADQFVADGLWPLAAGPRAGWDANGPFRNPYWELLERGYRTARLGANRVVLNGWFADELYNGAAGWLAALLKEGRLVEASRGLWAHGRSLGWRSCLGPVRAAIPGAALARARPAAPPAWLTAEAAALLRERGDDGRDGPAGGRAEAVLRARPVAFLDHELSHAHATGVELRMPFWNRKLVEFMLAIPSHLLYRRNRYKHIQRDAMRYDLPDVVLQPLQKTLLGALYRRGVLQNKAGWIGRLLIHPGARWRRFVREDWMWGVLQRLPDIQDQESIVFWQCMALELWPRKEAPRRSGLAAGISEGVNDVASKIGQGG